MGPKDANGAIRKGTLAVTLQMQHQTAAPQRTATPWTQATPHARKQRKPVVRRGRTQKNFICASSS
eukprot:352078-Chlamydomonas_euryale.AAC.6